MAKVQKTNNMAFKMKRSPAKNLGDFFGSIFSGKEVKGRQDAQRESNTGEYKGMTDFQKRRAEKKSRKAGESKFQADVRRKREKKAEETTEAPAEEENSKKAEKREVRKNNTVIKQPELTAQEKINKAYKGTGNDWAKASKNAMDMFGVTLTELIGQRSPAKKSRGYKMKRK